MRKIVLQGRAFHHYPESGYAVGGTFQQSNMPSGTQQERTEYYSATHKLHCYKTKLSVIPTGLCINCSSHYRGSATDITIFRDNKGFHQTAATKSPSEENMADDGPLHDQYPGSWTILADKGYQGLADSYCVLHPKRRHPMAPLTLEEEETNRSISTDRITIENYFGRIWTLWAVASDKYRWQEKKYETIFRACVALTNVQIHVT
ncbi:hypothetical protein JG688_00010124 [Phytophthora aleatoria]|uniref:DDE Tnp4 domain-containing protein n=1 Tax=Phytophthora aleatoria TaxID=2496075 RepID=A0A8J5J2H1_9STRA|nr:hypothetical protein JG688_00010124 [Phytophthora aleatoria]